MTDHIGQWAHRKGTRSHLVESQIDDRFVMRCGKVMIERIGAFDGSRLVFGPPTWGNAACLTCAGGRRNSLILNDEAPTLDTRGPDDRG